VTLLQSLANLLIYLSVGLGVILLPQLWFLVPSWLFYAVFAGWLAYFATALAVARHYRRAYFVASGLAILTLIVSLPQPEHYSYVKAGINMASVTFVIGSVLQVCVILAILMLFARWKRKSLINRRRCQ